MHSNASQNRTQIFRRAFKIWAGIMALPGAFLALPMISVMLRGSSSLRDCLLVVVYDIVAPGILFGAMGATVLMFLVSPGQKARAILIGTTAGVACPVGVFGTMMVVLPKKKRL